MKQFLKIKLTIVLIFSSFLLINIQIISGLAQNSEGEWQQPFNLSESGKNENPIVLIDSNGGYHAIWEDSYSGRYNYSNGDGTTWSKPQVLILPFYYGDGFYRLIPDNQGKIHAFWTDPDSNFYYSRVNAEDITKLALWSPPQLVDIAVIGMDITVDSENNLHLAYMRGEAIQRTAGIYYRQFPDGNTNWTLATEIDNSSYIRSISPIESNINISATENQNNLTTVYISWNNQPLARLFVATSRDTGKTWEEPIEVVGPDPSFSSDLPSDMIIEAYRNNALILWKLRDSTNNCSLRYISTSDSGLHWENHGILFDKEDGCPTDNHLFSTDQDEFILFTFINDEAYLLAWNGTNWSRPQRQTDVTNFIDPKTIRILDIQCRETILVKNILYMIGCDRDISGDIWITSRTIGSTEDWYPLPSAWSQPKILFESQEPISSLTSVSDENFIHTFWVQSSSPGLGTTDPLILYSRWEKTKWSNTVPAIWGTGGLPTQLTTFVDTQGRLSISWINQQSRKLYYSWANSDRANISTEWAEPVTLPSPSNIISSPDLLVDGAGKIMVYYAVNINEGRGIYFVESSDGGQSWSVPFLVFNADLAGWESIDMPKVSLTADGRLHLVFTQYSIKGEERVPTGLYYSQSSDGGSTWSEPDEVSKQTVQWSEIIGFGEGKVHRLWQEHNQSIMFVFDQISEDSGETWGEKINITGINGVASQIALTVDNGGRIHFVQITQTDSLIIQNLTWDGSSWKTQEVEQIDVTENVSLNSITAGSFSQNYLLVSNLFKKNNTIDLESTEGETYFISSINRFSGLSDYEQTPIPALISTAKPLEKTQVRPDIPTLIPTSTDQFDIVSTPIATKGSNEAISNDLPLSKNNLGFVFVGISILITVIGFVIFRLRQR